VTDLSKIPDIDRPILDILIQLNRMGFETVYSCCGYYYPGQVPTADHTIPYISFYAPFEKVRILNHELVNNTVDWGIIYDGCKKYSVLGFPFEPFTEKESIDGDRWRLEYFGDFESDCEKKWNKIRRILQTVERRLRP
jgi:hypothetical protein